MKKKYHKKLSWKYIARKLAVVRWGVCQKCLRENLETKFGDVDMINSCNINVPTKIQKKKKYINVVWNR